MQPEMTFTDAIVQFLIQMSGPFLVVCVVFVIFAWLRVFVDSLTPRGFF